VPTLIGYFPSPLGERYTEAMKRHPLRREIIATDLANATINRTGSVFIHRMQEETGASGPEIVAHANDLDKIASGQVRGRRIPNGELTDASAVDADRSATNCNSVFAFANGSLCAQCDDLEWAIGATF
jgi:hypothetical protein